MRALFKWKYPKISLLVVLTAMAYFIFSNQAVKNFIHGLGGDNYLLIFIAGFLFSFGFTTPFAVGMFLTMSAKNILLLSLVGGVGALIANNLIFILIKNFYMDEFYRLEKTKPLKEIRGLIDKNLNAKIRIYLLYIFSGIVFASPLPDEMGIIMLAGITHIKHKIFNVMSFLLHAAGIYILLLI